jgi:hypothetical protein
MLHTSEYRNFEIESFEAGKGLWHARFRCSDLEPLLIDGIPLDSIEVGFAWPNPQSAIVDAIFQIDRLRQTMPLS